MMDKSKSIEDQIKSLKKVENLDQYFINDFDDKELKSKIFKQNLLTYQISLSKSYLNKYLVTHLKT